MAIERNPEEVLQELKRLSAIILDEKTSKEELNLANFQYDQLSKDFEKTQLFSKMKSDERLAQQARLDRDRQADLEALDRIREQLREENPKIVRRFRKYKALKLVLTPREVVAKMHRQDLISLDLKPLKLQELRAIRAQLPDIIEQRHEDFLDKLDSMIENLYQAAQLKNAQKFDGTFWRFIFGSKIGKHTVKTEVMDLLAVLCKEFVFSVEIFLLFFLPFLFMGRFGIPEFAALGFALTLFIFSLYPPVSTILSALDSIVEGADWRTRGMFLQKSLLISTVLLIILSIFWANSDFVFTIAHLDSISARQAGDCVRIQIVGIICLLIFFHLKSVLLAKDFFVSTAIGVTLTLVFDLGVQSLLYYESSLGAYGVMWSQTLSFIFLLCFSSIVFLCTGSWQPKVQCSKESITGWGQFFQLGSIDGLLATSISWSVVVAVILGSLFEMQDSAANVVVLLVLLFFFSLFSPFYTVVSLQLKKHLLALDARLASLVYRVSLWFMLVLQIPIIVSIAVGRTFWGKVFLEDAAFLSQVPDLLLLCIFFSIAFGVQAINFAALKTGGKMKLGVICSFFVNFFIGLPLGCVFAFPLRWKVFGVWLGILLAQVVLGIILSVLVGRMDWKQATTLARRRAQSRSNSVEEITLLGSSSSVPLQSYASPTPMKKTQSYLTYLEFVE